MLYVIVKSTFILVTYLRDKYFELIYLNLRSLPFVVSFSITFIDLMLVNGNRF